MNRLLFCILFLLSQLAIAEQVHEIDISDCPENFSIYRGDTVRWINPTSHTYAVQSALFSMQYIAPNENYEYRFPPSLQPTKLSYFCLVTYGDVINNQPESVLTIERSPVAIFPKKTFLPTLSYFNATKDSDWIDYFDIRLFISDDHPRFNDSKIKGLSVLIDGQPVIGSMDELYGLMRNNNNIIKTAIWVNGTGSLVSFGNTGYDIFIFNLLKKSFIYNEKHLIQVSLTIDTGNGEATYQDEAEIFLIRGFFYSDF